MKRLISITIFFIMVSIISININLKAINDIYNKLENKEYDTEVYVYRMNNYIDEEIPNSWYNVKIFTNDNYDSSFKAYMDYRTITVQNSPQWILQQEATDYGIFRIIDGRYMIAVGTNYATQVGTKLDVEFENGETIQCVVGDIKQDIHTDPTNSFKVLKNKNGDILKNDEGVTMVNIIEFIVGDIDIATKSSGDVSYELGNLGNVKSITYVV